ncbi:hypothetical protein KBF38_01020 [bacterium]|nr:hypothetical protein [bacterium]
MNEETSENAKLPEASASGSSIMAGAVKLDPADFSKKPTLYLLALMALALVLTFVGYMPILFDFFAGDDYVHLIWLKEAVQHPELVWRNFHTSWLDGTTTKFYRPLISVFMVSDYVLWNHSAIGFHLTNLLFHLASTAFIFLIARELALLTLREEKAKIQEELSGKTYKALPISILYIWPFFSAAVFGLYPLHTETVSWITGRVDAVVTAFITGSFWFYLRARKTGGEKTSWFASRKASLTFSFILMVLALLSKEMAITLPAIFVLIELLYAAPGERPRSVLEGLLSKSYLLRALKNTAMYWGLIVVYFIVRRLALGTFVGGYDDSLFFIANYKAFIKTWLNGLRLFFEPLNHELISARAIPTRLWDFYLGLIGLGTLVNLVLTPALGRLFLFLCGWLVLSLAPVYKIFAIADDLQGSRLAYVATVPLAFLIALAVVVVSRGIVARKQLWSRSLLGVGFVALSFYVLHLNNQAWVDAGVEANSIRAGLSKLYKEVPGDPQILFVGLPDQIHGAYICRNALVGMTRTPQLERDAVNAIMVDKFEPILPFGYMKESLYKDRDKVLVYRWCPEAANSLGHFEKMELNDIKEYPVKEAKVFSAGALQTVLKPVQSENTKFEFLPDGTLSVIGGSGKLGRPEMRFDPGPINAYALEFVTVKLKQQAVSDAFKSASAKEGADLLYTNDLVPQFDIKRRTPTPMPTAVGEATLVFPLRSLPEWSLGGKSHGLTLRLPHDSNCIIEEITVAPAASLVPSLNFANSGYLGSKGFLHLSQEKKQDDITFDISQIKGDPVGVWMEVTRPNLLFEEQNCTTPSRVAQTNTKFKTAFSGKSGTITLKREDFSALGIYQLRLWPVFKDGSKGQASDHIVVAVDS